MPFLRSPVQLEVRGDGRFTLVQGVIYQGRRDCYRIPAGFVTDLASVPQALQWLVDDHGTYTRAAILHDYLWGEHRAGRLVSRRDADGLFRRVMREEGTPLLQRWLMWAAVRIGDGFEGGATVREWAAFAVLLIPGAVVALVTVPLLAVRALSWLLQHVLDPLT